MVEQVLTLFLTSPYPDGVEGLNLIKVQGLTGTTIFNKNNKK